MRIVGEPLCSGHGGQDGPACTRYEAMVNLAFAHRPVSVMCPYDTRVTGPELIRHVRATHPKTAGREGFVDCPDYGDPLDLVLES